MDLGNHLLEDGIGSSESMCCLRDLMSTCRILLSIYQQIGNVNTPHGYLDRLGSTSVFGTQTGVIRLRVGTSMAIFF